MTNGPKKINHVGFAVPNIQTFLKNTAPLYEQFSRGPLITNDRQRVRQMFLTDGGTTIEFLEPLQDDSPLRGFLNKNRTGGLLHLALEVVDLDAAIGRVTAAGGRLVVAPVPDVAFQERRIAFVFLGGQITELIEVPRQPLASAP